jgi:hypothetical protein
MVMTRWLPYFLKTGHMCLVFEWSTSLGSLKYEKSYKSIFLFIKQSSLVDYVFENRTGNRMVKDHLITGHKHVWFFAVFETGGNPLGRFKIKCPNC